MSNKKILIPLAIIILFLLAGIFYFVFFYNFGETNVPEKNVSQEQSDPVKEGDDDFNKIPVNSPDKQTGDKKTVHHSGENTTTVRNVQPLNKDNLTEMDLKKIAASFAERFGSYSNHSHYDNIKNLEAFMTDNMKEWAGNFIEEKSSREYSGNYHGITTNAVTSQIQEFNKEQGAAKVVVSTQRRERRGGEEPQTYNQDITLNFVKDNDTWKVDEAFWEE